MVWSLALRDGNSEHKMGNSVYLVLCIQLGILQIIVQTSQKMLKNHSPIMGFILQL